jgi:carbon monoxide dehydrogenase subunit G
VTHVSSTITIHAAADSVWQAISDFEAACRQLPGVVDCTLEGEGVGARRRLTNADGSTIVERLETLDEAARRLSYILETDTPFGNCLTSMTVRDLGPGQAELEWAASFQVAGIPESEAVEMLEGALAANCLALKRFLEG